MILRAAVLALVLATALVLDVVVAGALRWGGAAPSVVLLTVVGTGLHAGAERGARYGFGAGLVVDLLAGGLMGLHTLVHLLVGFAAGSLARRADGERLGVQIAVGGVATIAGLVGHAALTGLIVPDAAPPVPAVAGLAGAGALGGLLAPLVVRPVGGALRRVDVTR